MKIKLSSVLVDDQEKALRFYTDMLGFVKKTDLPMGETRWLTVVSSEEPDGTELVLEPESNPGIREATQAFKRTLYNAGIPYTAFLVDDLEAEVERLQDLGVTFVLGPTDAGAVVIAILDDTCGNLIQLFQLK